MTTRSVRIPDELDAKLAAMAAEDHISVNSAIIRALDEVLTRRSQEAAITAAADQVFADRTELFNRLADT
ncbi:toxin-antitoxin system HicB family antitoxin [Actinomadura sp. KC345]|uniref:toxin-antitoxin system HicB family antitoxin n=1 Tax=Actinomadura sp. KC345 TaxID=2530371 RepID=UPI001049F11D|nr:toxin-antitoxin system HicB family antitoxin [Actinomadura sp. KC345]TDC58116.1 toxin-antitoxin system HicB family antitoxin [Actinomadura sp. KC345]